MRLAKTTSNALAAALIVTAASLPQAQAITITTDSFTGFDMDFAAVGDTTNVDDVHGAGYGAVSYDYRMGVNEVSEAMIDAYNANSGGPTITMSTTRGADKPATSITWNEAARFVNWLNTSQGYTAAYLFADSDINTNISLWDSADAWQLGGENLYRHKDAYYFLPSEDEWYKAAYYDGNTATYYDYATGSDTAPTAVASGTTSGTAVYDQSFGTGPADITQAGGLSPYGTMGQNGNAWEWGESAFTAPNDDATEFRVFRGGDWFTISSSLQSSARSGANPVNEANDIGFRVASVSVVPEPSSVGLLVIGAMGCVMRRKRG